MCCFSQPVEHVSATKIFARPLAEGLQGLVYSMSFAAAGELAMILPLPVPAGPAEDAVRFIDLAGYRSFFDDMKKAFPAMLLPAARGTALMPASIPKPQMLKVHDVGLFEASFVPTLSDFDRLDARFRLSPEVWDQLPRYRDWGFAVFKLKRQPVGVVGRLLGRAHAPQGVHPMAFVFPRRDARSIFFPTVHVHDGEVHDEARFDHTLYCQPDELIAETFAWERSDAPLGKHVDAGRSGGLVDGAQAGFRLQLLGPQPNQDIELIPPRCGDLSSLRQLGRCFELRIRARSAYRRASDDKSKRWRATACEHIDTLSAALRDGLSALLEAQASAWDLCSYDDQMIECSFHERGVYVRAPVIESGGLRQLEPASGPLRVHFMLSSDRVEPQDLWLSFANVPEPQRLQAIQARLEAVLESVPL